MPLWRYSYGTSRREARSVLTDWQGGRCAGCLLPCTPLLVDHDHATDYVRGMLCHACNTREGHVETIAWALYLDEPPGQLGTRLAVLDSFVGRCEVALEEARAEVSREWCHDFEARGRAAFDAWVKAFKAWQRQEGERPAHPEFEEWRRREMQAEKTARASLQVDEEALYAAGIEDSYDIWMATMPAVTNLTNAIQRADRSRMIARLAAELADAAELHEYVGQDAPESLCEHSGCDFPRRRHPLNGNSARQALARVDSLVTLQADLTGALSAAA